MVTGKRAIPYGHVLLKWRIYPYWIDSLSVVICHILEVTEAYYNIKNASVTFRNDKHTSRQIENVDTRRMRLFASYELLKIFDNLV